MVLPFVISYAAFEQPTLIASVAYVKDVVVVSVLLIEVACDILDRISIGLLDSRCRKGHCD